MGLSSYMDLLFQPDTNSTPLPSQLHTPLNSSLLAVGASGDCGTGGALVGIGASGDCGTEGASVGVAASGDCGVEGVSLGIGALGDVASVLGGDVDTSTRGASTDDRMESDDHPPAPETQVHI
jgi:hypothetical protein